MIEVILALLGFLGFGLGDVDKPNAVALDTSTQQTIRAIDSIELQGLNTLETHNAEEWFV